MKLRLLQERDLAAWDSFLERHRWGRAEAASQALAWHARDGWQLQLLGVFRGDELVAGAACCTRVFPGFSFRLARVLALLPAAAEPILTTVFLIEGIQALAVSQGAAEVEVRCRIVETDPDYWGVEQALFGQGYRPAGPPSGTYLVPLDRCEDELLAAAHYTCRRKVRKCRRAGMRVIEVATRADLARLTAARRALGARKQLDRASLSELDETCAWPLVESGRFRLFAAVVQDRALNLAMVDALGTPQFRMGALTPAGLASGLPTGHGMHFEIMRRLREEGHTCYDLGSAPGPVPDPAHRKYKVWRFKYDLGGLYRRWLPTHRLGLGWGSRLACLARLSGYLSVRWL